jgi:hypothetical protein
MTKTEIWTKVLEIIDNYELSTAAATDLEALLKPKSGGASNRIVKIIDEVTYKNCRFTGLLWPVDELVCQNDQMKSEGKDKGYSKTGISVWSKGQKYIKSLKDDMTTIILSDEPDMNKLAELKTELKDIEVNNLGNDFKWLEQFLTEDQEKEVKHKALPLDTEA